MQPYSDSVAITGAENVLRPITGAVVTLTNSLGTLETLYSDNGVTSIGTSVTTDAEGNFTCYAADGRYTVTISYNGAVVDTRPLLLEDPASPSTVNINGGTITGVTITGSTIDGGTPIVTGIMTSSKRIGFNSAGIVLAIGRNSDNAGASYQGLQIGGGDASYGADGVLFGNDGHASWLRLQPSKNESPIELLVYPTASQGIATATSGTNQVARVSGTSFSSAWVGKKIYIGETAYKVGTYVDANNITVTTTAGGAVSFGSTFDETFHVCYVSGTGTCNVSGTTVTRVSGDPFIAFFTEASFVFKINGTTRTVSANANTSTYTLSAPPGDVSGATYTFEVDINDQISTIRIQKMLGSDEENVSLFARYDGYWIASQYSGSGKYRPVILSSGELSSAAIRQINVYSNGDTLLGGAYGNDAIRVLARSGTVANRLDTQAATAGNRPGWRARGTDTNVGMALDMQAEGDLLITNGSFTRSLFNASAPTGATSYVGVVGAAGTASVKALGAANSILALLSDGTGNITLSSGSGGQIARFLHVATAINYLDFSGSAAGGRTTMRVRGGDTDPGLNIDLQGTGDLLITGGSFARTLGKFTGNSSADVYPTLDANVGYCALTATGTGDLRLTPGASGLIRIGTATTAAATPANFTADRTLAFKDSSGTTYYLPLMAATW